jgi:hypothetical protein
MDKFYSFQSSSEFLPEGSTCHRQEPQDFFGLLSACSPRWVLYRTQALQVLMSNRQFFQEYHFYFAMQGICIHGPSTTLSLWSIFLLPLLPSFNQLCMHLKSTSMSKRQTLAFINSYLSFSSLAAFLAFEASFRS